MPSEQTGETPSFAVINGCLSVNGMLLTGNQYTIPWWSGRVKDNFVQYGAKPAITRFVPGREGNGWTDRIDSVVIFLANNHYTSLYHNYGLWYDLRRTDHERIRRADGDVWAPFYEQPFTRSGEGIAWDGLSRYDLTKPNRWYWNRLNEFAQQSASRHIFLYSEHYFQHNILEAGAHWVDCLGDPSIISMALISQNLFLLQVINVSLWQNSSIMNKTPYSVLFIANISGCVWSRPKISLT